MTVGAENRKTHHEPHLANYISLRTAADWLAESARSLPLVGRLAQLSKKNFLNNTEHLLSDI